MLQIQIQEFLDASGRSPFGRWFDGLNATAAARITTTLTRLSCGDASTVEGAGAGVIELKIDFGPGYRVYFGKDGETPQAHQGETLMALTKRFRETVYHRAQHDAAYRKALLTEAVNAYLGGDELTGKTVLRDVINATIGFEQLAAELRKPSKSLHRMLGPRGNPNTANFFAILQVLQKHVGVKLTVKAA